MWAGLIKSGATWALLVIVAMTTDAWAQQPGISVPRVIGDLYTAIQTGKMTRADALRAVESDPRFAKLEPMALVLPAAQLSASVLDAADKQRFLNAVEPLVELLARAAVRVGDARAMSGTAGAWLMIALSASDEAAMKRARENARHVHGRVTGIVRVLFLICFAEVLIQQPQTDRLKTDLALARAVLLEFEKALTSPGNPIAANAASFRSEFHRVYGDLIMAEPDLSPEVRRARAVHHYSQAVQFADDKSPDGLSSVLERLAHAHAPPGHHDARANARARAALRHGLEILKSPAASDASRCDLSVLLGTYYLEDRTGDQAQKGLLGLEVLRAAVKVCERASDRDALATARHNIASGYVNLRVGVRATNLRFAKTSIEEALAHRTPERAPDYHLESIGLQALILSRLDSEGEGPEAALAIIDRAIADVDKWRSLPAARQILRVRCWLLEDTGAVEDARRACRAALDAFDEGTRQRIELQILLARLAQGAGETYEPRRLLDAAVEAAKARQDHDLLAHVHAARSGIRADPLAEPTDAIPDMRQALKAAEAYAARQAPGPGRRAAFENVQRLSEHLGDLLLGRDRLVDALIAIDRGLAPSVRELALDADPIAGADRTAALPAVLADMVAFKAAQEDESKPYHEVEADLLRLIQTARGSPTVEAEQASRRPALAAAGMLRNADLAALTRAHPKTAFVSLSLFTRAHVVLVAAAFPEGKLLDVERAIPGWRQDTTQLYSRGLHLEDEAMRVAAERGWKRLQAAREAGTVSDADARRVYYEMLVAYHGHLAAHTTDMSFNLAQRTIRNVRDHLTWGLGHPEWPAYAPKMAAHLLTAQQGAMKGLERDLALIDRLVAQPLASALKGTGVQRVVVVDPSALGGLPLAAAPALRGFVMSESSSLAIHRANVARLTDRREVTSLKAVANPTGDLPCSELEVRHVAAGDRLVGSAANVHRVSELLARKAGPSEWWISSHGRFIAGDLMRSSLLLADQTALRLNTMVDVPFGAARLVVLSSCESGSVAVSNGEQGWTFPLVLAATGVSQVIATRWEVDQVASLLLLERFRRDRDAGLPTAAALHAAQRWLAGLSLSDVRSAVRNIAESADTPSAAACLRRVPGSIAGGSDRPYAHPYFWAAFGLYE